MTFSLRPVCKIVCADLSPGPFSADLDKSQMVRSEENLLWIEVYSDCSEGAMRTRTKISHHLTCGDLKAQSRHRECIMPGFRFPISKIGLLLI
jgi:hypothetical protein